MKVAIVLVLSGLLALFFWNYTIEKAGPHLVIHERGTFVVETKQGGEFLILNPQQAAECQLGNGCAVFSEREWLQSIMQILRRGQSL